MMAYTRMALAALLLPFSAEALVPKATTARRGARVAVRAEDEPTSLGGVMAKQLFGGLQGVFDRLKDDDGSSATAVSVTDVAAGREAARAEGAAVADIDARAQQGDVTFEDFLKVGRTFRQMGGKMPGMPGTLSETQVKETLEKFDLHEKIVLSMTDEEKADPQLLMDDLKDTDNKCPRVQRLAKASGCEEKQVALFCADFEAMRQSTQRIAAGEDPDAVNADIGSSNRAQRRAAKKAQKKRR